MINKLKYYLLAHSEYFLLLSALALFAVSPILFRLYDPTAGVFDIGVLQINITSVISLFIFQSVTWMVLKLIWPALRIYFETEFDTDFSTLAPWQKITIGLTLYCFFVLALVLLNQTVPGAASIPAIR